MQTPANPNHLSLDIVTLDLAVHRARQAGQFDAAASLDGLAGALRSGQLTRSQLHTSDSRCRLFGGRGAAL